jgi:hypothetical protein
MQRTKLLSTKKTKLYGGLIIAFVVLVLILATFLFSKVCAVIFLITIFILYRLKLKWIKLNKF